jgi:hypothetical protein
MSNKYLEKVAELEKKALIKELKSVIKAKHSFVPDGLKLSDEVGVAARRARAAEFARIGKIYLDATHPQALLKSTGNIWTDTARSMGKMW